MRGLTEDGSEIVENLVSGSEDFEKLNTRQTHPTKSINCKILPRK
jgi:hypothetical protein